MMTFTRESAEGKPLRAVSVERDVQVWIKTWTYLANGDVVIREYDPRNNPSLCRVTTQKA